MIANAVEKPISSVKETQVCDDADTAIVMKTLDIVCSK